MPFIRDKIIINDGGLRSFRLILRGWFEGIEQVMSSGESLAREIEAQGWLQDPEALDFLKQQESDCALVDAACHSLVVAISEFHSKQMSRNEEMRLWIDFKLGQKP